MPSSPQTSYGDFNDPGSSPNHKDYFWDFTRFKVQGTFFQLPTLPFRDGSAVFATRFGLPVVGPQITGEKRALIVLDDIEVVDFEAFLKVLLPPMVSPFSSVRPTIELSMAEWRSTLKLSTLWHFNSLRSIAIDHLSPYLETSADQSATEIISRCTEFIALARTYHVSAWLAKAYRTLTQTIASERSLTFAEAGGIGHETAHELQGFVMRRSKAQTDDERKDESVSDSVPLFKAELSAIRKEEEKFGSVGPRILKAKALFDYTATEDNEVSFVEDELLDVLDKDRDWWEVRKANGAVGYVPANYLELI